MASRSGATQSARTVALVLAVLGYRHRLRRRDRWSRSELLAYQERALRQLREHAYQKSRFTTFFMKVFPRRRCLHSRC
jgi:hypothetical protein